MIGCILARDVEAMLSAARCARALLKPLSIGFWGSTCIAAVTAVRDSQIVV